MVLTRFYVKLTFFGFLCFLLFVLGLGFLFFADLRTLDLQTVVALGVLTSTMAVFASTFWLAKIVLELGFLLREQIQEHHLGAK